MVAAAFSILLITISGVLGFQNNNILLIGIANFCVIPVALWFIIMDGRRRNPLKTIHRPLTFINGVWIVALGASTAYVMNVIISLSQLQKLFPGANELAEQAGLYDQPLWLLILAGGILAPIAEELIFRGLVYLRLRDYLGVKNAIVISSLLFGIYHGNVVQGIYAFSMGMLFAYGMEKFKSLWAAILLHMAGNSWMFILQEFLVDWSKVLYGLPVLLLMAGQFIIIFFSVFRMRKMD